MKKNESNVLWRYFRNFIDLAVSSNWQMAAFIVYCGAMVSCSKPYWDVQSHKTNSSTNIVIASPSKSLTESLSDMHPDCSDSGIYQPLLIEEHDEVHALY